MFTYSEHVLKICVAQLSRHAGYKSINGLAFEILIDLLSRFMLEFGKLSASLANQCNRTQVNFDDIQFVFKSLGLSLADLTGYLVNVQLPFAGRLPPVYPISTQNKPSLRICNPTRGECESRKEFYQDWQPTLNLDAEQSFLAHLSPHEQQQIEQRLEQLDLVDFFEQQHQLKIVDDPKLNRKVLNHIRSQVNKLNISGFTELTAQVPNYIYLSADGEALSFGNKPGRLPEARRHTKDTKESDSSRSSSKHRHLKNKKKASRKSRSSSGADRRSKKSKRHEPAFDINNNEITDYYQSAYYSSDRPEQLSARESLRPSVEESDRHKSCEQIVSELVDAMISNVEEKFSGLDESFYDENEAAKTLVLLSYDSNNSKSLNSSAAESPVIERNNIDYSLSSKFNGFHNDLNNNHSLSDLNNNLITAADFKDQLRNGGFGNRLSSSSESAASTDNYPVNDVKKLTIRDELREHLERAEEDDQSKPFTKNSSNNSNLPKLKLTISFDKYKRGDSSLEDDAEIDQQLSGPPIVEQSPNQPTSKSTGKPAGRSTSKPASDHRPSITNKPPTNHPTNQPDPHHLSSTPSLTTKEKQRKRKGKKQLNNSNAVDGDLNGSIPDQRVYYCPTCGKPDDTKTPMIGCDSCEEWLVPVCSSLVNRLIHLNN